MLTLRGTRHPTADVGGYYSTPFPSSIEKHRPPTGQVYPRKNTTNSFNKQATFSLASNHASRTNGQTATITLSTSNVPDGTPIQYLITAKPTSGATQTLIPYGFSGVYTVDTRVIGTTGFDTRPNTGNRVVTTSATEATHNIITNNLLGAAALTVSTPTVPNGLTFTGNGDDGFWTVTLPFNITFLNQSYSTVYIGTNTYITFGGGSSTFLQIGSWNPPWPKIMISSGDNLAFRIYRGVEGSSPNRTFRIRWEGHNSFQGGDANNPDMIYEVTFYENTPTKVEVHTGVNSRWALEQSNPYPFSVASINVPLVGTMTVNSGQATLPITVNTAESLEMNVRLGIFPSPSVNITIN
jgi:hypothetical protein